MGNAEYQGGGSSFLLKFIIFIIVFVSLVSYVVSRNGEAILAQ